MFPTPAQVDGPPDPGSIVPLMVLGFLVFAVLIVGLAIAAQSGERKRRDSLREWAAGSGWQEASAPVEVWGQRLPGRRGTVPIAFIGRVAGRTAWVAEYQYTESSGTTNADGTTSTSSTTHRYVVYVLGVRAPGPSVAVYRRGALSRLGRSLFGDRPTAVGNEAFDAAYRIAAHRPEDARAAIGPELVAEHLAGRLPEWSLHGAELMTYETGRIDGSPVPGRFAALLRVAELIERRLTASPGTPPPSSPGGPAGG